MATSRSALPYLPGLDGIRALAVLAVLLYHADLPVRGGFLGVEVFFVLSGFLITALLVGEQADLGRIDMRAFWARRARRLLPALVVVLVGVAAIAAALPRGEAVGLGADMLASLGYVMNWHLVAGGQSYFDAAARPSLLRHLWSLAVEEQFYLIWPLLFVGGLRLLRPLGLLLGTIALAAASAALAASLYDPGADPSRVYYGTDTRASGILIGAALAMLWAPWRQPGLHRRAIGRGLDLAGALSLGALVFASLALFDTHPMLYNGGLVGISLLSATLIAAVTHPQARLLPAALSWAPLRWLGVRSYGIYLWHWPILQVTRPYLDLPFDTPLLLAARFASVLLMAELSYRLVEEPIRRGALARLWRLVRERPQAAQPAPMAWLPIGAAAGGPSLQTTQSGSTMSFFSTSPSGDQRPGRTLQTHRPTWRSLTLLITTLAVVMSAACSSLGAPSQSPAAGESTPSPLPVAVATVEEAPTVAHTATPAASPTIAASPTQEPSATATATATATNTALPAAASATAMAELPAIDEELAEALQAVLDRTVADGSIPGAVVAVNIPGRQTWVGASGLADIRDQTPMTPDTRVRIASISKVFTAATVLLLVEEGSLSLDDTLDTWFPNLVPNAEQITVRNLLQHTTGLYDFLEDRQYVTIAYQRPDRVFAPSELVSYAARFPPAFEPGADGAWDYSSTNYVILGMVVEAVTGRTLAVEMRERIFEPLGLTGTYFAPDEPIGEPFATGTSRGTVQRDAAMSFAFGTANLVSTAEDVQTFGRALFAGDLLSDETRELMMTFVGGKGQYNMPSLAYGLGVMRNVLPVDRAEDVSTVYGHTGGFAGFRSALWHAPESGVTIALGVNQGLTDPNLLATDVFDAVLDGLGK